MALRQFRAAFTPEAGIAAVYNNRAAVRLVQRDFEAALKDEVRLGTTIIQTRPDQPVNLTH